VTRVATIVNIDVMLAKRKMSMTELAERVGITMANLSILKNGKARAIRFSTLERICHALDCQPGDIIEYRSDDASMSMPSSAAHDTEPPTRPRSPTSQGKSAPRVRG
jgi:putative transcriptional regulator